MQDYIYSVIGFIAIAMHLILCYRVMFKPGQYDLVLMDIQMPRMNGYDATRAIRDLPNSYKANIPIVAMTANAFEEDKQNAIDAGMNAHLSKPIDIPKFISTLAKIIGEE